MTNYFSQFLIVRITPVFIEYKIVKLLISVTIAGIISVSLISNYGIIQ